MLSIILYKFPEGIRDILFIQFVPPSFGLKGKSEKCFGKYLVLLREKQLYLKCENGKERRKNKYSSSSLEVGGGQAEFSDNQDNYKETSESSNFTVKRKNEETGQMDVFLVWPCLL